MRRWSPLENSSHLIPQGALEYAFYSPTLRRGADLLYPCVSQPLAVCILGVRCGLTNPKWLGTIVPKEEAAVSHSGQLPPSKGSGWDTNSIHCIRPKKINLEDYPVIGFDT